MLKLLIQSTFESGCDQFLFNYFIGLMFGMVGYHLDTIGSFIVCKLVDHGVIR